MHIWWCCYDLRYFFYARHDWLPTNLYKVHRYFFLSWCDLQNYIMYIYFFLHCRIRLPVDYWRHVMDRFVCKNMLIIVCCLLTLANRKKDFLLTFTGYLLRVLVQHIKTKYYHFYVGRYIARFIWNAEISISVAIHCYKCLF